ncbi:hypothetical protein BJV82DRAFT_576834 [Fennellomyces sp. T-0311]|nr:hypothetical protein BJV82DRAFT_576834 [Fennellomyces sp. T-0311]
MTALESLRHQCLKELKVQPLQDLWKGAKDSFDSHHYLDAVQDLTAAVDEIEQNVLAVTLLKRAVAYSCQGNFEAGIKDAYKVMKLAPSLFEGYFCAGSLLHLTGDYRNAQAVYTEGISAVSGQCSEYEQLIRAKRAVEDHIREANTALFKKLPYELLAHIFGDLLSFNDQLHYSWRGRIRYLGATSWTPVLL